MVVNLLIQRNQHTKLLTGIVLISLLIPIIITIDSNANTASHQKNIIWDAQLVISETSGIHDTIRFGEAPDAGDSIPPDLYDVPKPPLYLPPFIRAWFNDNLPIPYDALSEDYRTFPADEKTWNLTIQWTPADYTSATEITIAWNKTILQKSPYKHIMLTNENYTVLTDMLQSSSYIFNCTALIPQHFHLIATRTTYVLSINQTGNGNISINPVLPSYYPGTRITLRAIPDQLWCFSHWNGSVQTTNPEIIIRITENTSLHANFIINDTNPPTIIIKQPQPGLYIRGRLLHRYHINRMPIIFGDITIFVNAMDSQSAIDTVELYIDDKLCSISYNTSLSYEWVRTKHSMFHHRHVIKIVAYDENRNHQEVNVYLKKYF